MPGTDLRVYRNTASRGWEELEILSNEVMPKSLVELTVETEYFGIFVVLCCAARTIHSVEKGSVELFGGIGMELKGPQQNRVDIVCEIEPPIEDYTQNFDLAELPPTPYLPQGQSETVSGSESHPTIFSLRLLEDEKCAEFEMTVPDGYCLGILETENSSKFKRLQTPSFELNSTKRLQLCVWKIQSNEKFIHVNRFHQMPLRLFVKLIQNCKNYTLKGK